MPLLPMKRIWTPLELFQIFHFRELYEGRYFYRIGKYGKLHSYRKHQKEEN